MLAGFGKFLVVTALVFAIGLHWAALQTVAWTTMLASNLRCEPFAQAVGQTFDGQHPCCLCKAIAAAKKSERKSEAVSPVLKLEFPPVMAQNCLFPPAPLGMIPRPYIFAEPLPLAPPVPPPRCLPA